MTHMFTSLGLQLGTRNAGSVISPVVPSPRIMIVGDSITDGRQYPGEGNGFLVQLAVALADLTPVFVGPYTTAGISHAGFPGERLDQMSLNVAGWVTTYTPDIVLVIGGLNDARASATGATMASRLSSILSEVHNASATARVVVAQIPWVFPQPAVRTALIDYNTAVTATVAASAVGSAGLARVVDLRGCSPTLSARDCADTVPPPSRAAFVRYAASLEPVLRNAAGHPAIWPG